MRSRILATPALATAAVLTANLVLVPLVNAEDARVRLERAQKFMTFSDVGGGWVDQRKAMLTLKQRVKDSRLDLDMNGVDFYKGKAKVMLDLERQRMRQAARFLFENGHGERVAKELRDSNDRELIELANNLQLSAKTIQNAVKPMDVMDNYLSFRVAGYESAIKKLDKDEVRKVMVDTEKAVDSYVASGGDTRKLDIGLFAEDDTTKGRLMRWVIGAIAGVGLVIAVFFSLSTMTITPFLTFMATVVGLLALLGRNGAFQSIFYGNPYGPTPGPYNPYQPWNPYWPTPQPPPPGFSG